MKKDSRKKLNIHPFYQERLNKVAKARKRIQKTTLEILIDNDYEKCVEEGLIKE